MDRDSEPPETFAVTAYYVMLLNDYDLTGDTVLLSYQVGEGLAEHWHGESAKDKGKLVIIRTTVINRSRYEVVRAAVLAWTTAAGENGGLHN